jgi:hypothetical protein
MRSQALIALMAALVPMAAAREVFAHYMVRPIKIPPEDRFTD